MYMSGETLFEKIISGKIPCHKVSEGESWFAFLDIFPRREGHTLVVPKHGVKHISELSDKEISELFVGLKRVQSILSNYFHTEDFTVCVHDGEKAGQEVPHVHIHVIPRTPGDGGLTLMSMWPNTRNAGGEANHDSLGILASKLRGDFDETP
ncbi:MAG: HIT family hydrolase [Euryarchaeota archaeon]|nr:HIT family hydrolase [Euryarchaeota archaeon]MBR95483.1 HIT family hydrolase [Euryarchaeota archaeon]|tara:strand:+ start:2688 stop:3143 length:456 start_codon:yes stop_codon:yes gene_type:complete